MPLPAPAGGARASSPGPRCLRAPWDRQDFLSDRQLEDYLSLLRAEDLEALSPKRLCETSRKALAVAGVARGLAGPELAAAVLWSLGEASAPLRRSIEGELEEPAAVGHALRAYRARPTQGGTASSCRGQGSEGRGSLAPEELPAFVRFCIGYRIHCYFTTSFLQEQQRAVSAPADRRPEVVFVLGSPGLGRSAQCLRIAETFGYRRLEAGGLLSGQAGAAAMEPAAAILLKAIRKWGWQGGRYLIEGFPSTLEDLEGWERLAGECTVLSFCLLFEAPEAVLVEGDCGGSRPGGSAGAVVGQFHAQQSASPLLRRLAARGLLRRVPTEANVEEVWRRVRAFFGPTVVFVLGAPGAGKGTQCTRISQTFGHTHISVGDMLRGECARDPDIARCLREVKLVPSSTTMQLLLQRMQELGWQGKKYVIDGFPRSFENLEAWHASVGHTASVKLCLHLECSQGVGEARLLELGTGHQLDYSPESIRKRFATWYHESLPVLETYKADGLLRRVDAERGVEAVWSSVQELFGPKVVFVLSRPGSGVEEQCSRVSKAFGYRWLRPRELLQAERLRAGPEARLPSDAGPAAAGLVTRLLRQAMDECGWEGGKYLVEGFPTSLGELDSWTQALGRPAPPSLVLRFERPQAGKADEVPGALTKSGTAVYRIDSGRGVEEVWADVRRLFGPSVIFVLGGPGAGKKTQSLRISESFGYHHLDVGGLLREERMRPGSELGQLVAACIQEGRPVPAELMLRLLRRTMEELGWEGGRYLISGFPRNTGHLEAWAATLGQAVAVKLALLLECSEPCAERLLERGDAGCSPCPDAETLKRRMEVFQVESVPMAQQLEAEGLLRRVDGDQDVEAVWSCVQEVLHLELDAELQNHAIVFIKHKASNDETERFVHSFLASHKIAVLRSGTVPASEVLTSGLFDRQYSQIMTYATSDPMELQVSAASQERFRAEAGESWADAAAKGRLLSAAGALASWGLSAVALAEAWQGGTIVKLEQYLSVAWIAGSGGPGVFVINGFAPQWRGAFADQAGGAGAGRVRWLSVEFSPVHVPWHRFRSEILGATNPAEAAEHSIRGQFYRHWARLGLQQPPDTYNNCVHASSGPLEGLREWMLWTGGALRDHPLARSLLSGGVPEDLVRAWLENPRVEGWRLGQEAVSGPVFACSEGCDHAALRASALHHVRSAGHSLYAWPVGEKSVVRLPSRRPSRRVPMAPKLPHPVLTLLHFNDVYNVEPRRKEPVGGIARFATRMRELRAEASARGEEALCLFSGDAFNPSLTSTVTKGAHMVPALNAVGIDVACYGNHDFDFGEDELVDMASKTHFPWLISNVVDRATSQPLANGELTLMVDCQGRKVGLIGLVEREWLVTLHSFEPEDLVYEDFCPCARRLARQLREEGAELVLALTHMRQPNDELLAQEVPEVDLILGGHDHHYEVGPVGPHGTYLLKSGTDFRDITVLRLRFTGGPGPRAFEVLETRHVEIDSSIAEDPEMKELVQECESKVGSAMDEVLGESAIDLDCRFSSVRTRETNIGNFVTDVMRTGLKADIALINSGTLRADAIIEKGKITVRDLLSVLPMLDELCLLELSGAQVLAVLQNGVSMYPRLEGRFVQVSGVAFAFDATKPPGQRLDEATVRVGGKTLDAQERYRVCTLNYLRQGKDGFDVLRGAMCLADGEQAGILPTLVRDHLASVCALNGLTPTASRYRVRRANCLMDQGCLARTGEGPSPLQQFAIRPEVEGRIRCLNGGPA